MRQDIIKKSLPEWDQKGVLANYLKSITQMRTDGPACVFVCVCVRAFKWLNLSARKERNKKGKIKRSRYEEIEKVLEEGWCGYGGGGWSGGWGGTTMCRQFQFQFQDFFFLSKIFLSLRLFLHSLLSHFRPTFSHSYKNSSSPFASISLSFSQFVPSHSTFLFPSSRSS